MWKNAQEIEWRGQSQPKRDLSNVKCNLKTSNRVVFSSHIGSKWTIYKLHQNVIFPGVIYSCLVFKSATKYAEFKHLYKTNYFPWCKIGEKIKVNTKRTMFSCFSVRKTFNCHFRYCTKRMYNSKQTQLFFNTQDENIVLEIRICFKYNKIFLKTSRVFNFNSSVSGLPILEMNLPGVF